MWTFEDTTLSTDGSLAQHWAADWKRRAQRLRMASRSIAPSAPAFSMAAWQDSSCFCYWTAPRLSSGCSRCCGEIRFNQQGT